MREVRVKSWVASLVGLVILSVAGAASLQAQTGIVTGRITAEDSKAPLTDAQVVVVGTAIYTTSGSDGKYTLRGVPAGLHTIRAIRVGYVEQKKTTNINAGSTTIDFEMPQTVVKLQEVVTTATGEQRKVELGHSVATVDVAQKITEAPIKNMGDLLVSRAPSVQVLPANMTGGGSRVRIRGTSSFSLSNDPIYIIDGIRMTSGNGGLSVGGTTDNRASDLSPEEIENIEIVKGPSAATLYGTDASNGVIVITTKRGRVGTARWNVFVEHGQIKDNNTYPSQYAILGHSPGTTTQRRCSTVDLGLGACLMDSAVSLNMFSDPWVSPLKIGARDNYGVQVTGGSDAVRYFIGTEIQKETGPFGLPAMNQAYYDSTGTGIKDNVWRPNTLGQVSFRANVGATINPKLDVQVSTGFIKLDQRLPQVDNNVNSFWYNGETGPGYLSGPGYTGTGSLGQKLWGWANYTPGEIFQQLATESIQRFIGSTNVNYRPTSWLQARADVGMDLTDRDVFGLCQFANCADFSTNRLGFANDGRTNIRSFSASPNATASWGPRPWLNTKLTLGIQYNNFKSDRTTGSGSTLPPGAQTPAQGTTPSVSNSTQQQNTLGMFAEEAASINERLFLTAAVRSDQNSAFGQNFQRVYYPKFSASWIVSDEDFFPRIKGLDQLRIRSALGTSGVQPGPTDALRTFSTTTTAIQGSDVSGLRSNQLGNPSLRPETSREFEMGFDARALNSRLDFELTYYIKRSSDAIFSITPPPSSGSPQTSIRTNLGGTQNSGIEMKLQGQLVDTRNFGWDIIVAGSHNSNKLVALGTDAAGNPIPIPGLAGTTQEVPGYPLFGYWGRPYTYKDANGDGWIVPSEVIVNSTDTVVTDKNGVPLELGFHFKSYSQPRDNVSITNGMEFLGRKLRVTALIDYAGGSGLFNNLEGFLCPQSQGGKGCRFNASPTASIPDQARAVATGNSGTLNTGWGFIETDQFWRLREVSATYTLPDKLAGSLLRAKGASVTMAVRNVKIWTSYSGTDPEANYGEGNQQNTLLTAGPPRYYQLRVNVNY